MRIRNPLARTGRFTVTMLTVCLTLAGASAAAARAVASPLADAMTTVTQGRLHGVVQDGVARFHGVPYASPPVGARRWAPPASPSSWSGVRDASRDRASCPQNDGDGELAAGTSEDCLYLGVTAPVRESSGKPVMVWLHGGGFNSGSGTDYDPMTLASHGDVVVITVDFRIGVFGNLGLPGMTGGGDFGLLDEQAALRWVRQNAAAFGGDPHNVTVFGESGGGVGTCGLLTSPASQGLFDKAIIQSGSCMLNWPDDGFGPGIPAGSFWQPIQQVEEASAETAAKLGCQGDPAAITQCLRQLPTSAIYGSGSGFGTAATGTATLPQNPADALKAGRFLRVPVISGHTHDEARAIAGVDDLLGVPITEQSYRQMAQASFGDDADRVLAEYPIKDYPSAALAWSAMDTDRVFVCTQLQATAALSRYVTTYGYEFADPQAPSYEPASPSVPPGASHGSDLNYLFDQAGGQPATLTADQKKLKTPMIAYWAQFAWTSNPNHNNAAQWSPWNQRHTSLSLAPGNLGIASVDSATEHHCSFWSTIPE